MFFFYLEKHGHPAAGSTGSTESTGSAPKNPDIAGHRRRMRDKVIDKTAATLTELELLEMILYPSNPRGDTKPMAKRLMRELGSLAGILRASLETLQQLDQVGPAAIATIKVTEAAVLHLSNSRIRNQSVMRNWVDVQDYCINRMVHERREHFIISCLDNQNRLISEETMSVGTVNQTAVYPRSGESCVKASSAGGDSAA
jgi:DNA repair protein RadC